MTTPKKMMSATRAQKGASNIARPHFAIEAATAALTSERETSPNLFYGSKGYIALADGDQPENYRSWLGKEQRPGPEGRYDDEEVVHFQNFVDCVISRKKEDLNAPIEEGHMSCALVHLANASYRLKRTVNFNPDTQQVIGDEEAAELVRDGGRGYRAPFTVPEEV